MPPLLPEGITPTILEGNPDPRDPDGQASLNVVTQPPVSHTGSIQDGSSSAPQREILDGVHRGMESSIDYDVGTLLHTLPIPKILLMILFIQEGTSIFNFEMNQLQTISHFDTMAPTSGATAILYDQSEDINGHHAASFPDEQSDAPLEQLQSLPDPKAPLAPTHLEIPDIPDEIKEMSNESPISVRAEPPQTPLELPSLSSAEADSAGPSQPPPMENSHMLAKIAHGNVRLPDPAATPTPTELTIPNISPTLKHLDSSLSPSLIVNVTRSPSLDVSTSRYSRLEDVLERFTANSGDQGGSSDINAFPVVQPQSTSSVESASPNPHDPPPPTDLIVPPEVHEVFTSEGVTPSMSTIVHPPTSPPPEQSTSSRSARMSSPALGAARRVPLSARLEALQRSVSGSSSTGDVSPPRFAIPLSPELSPLKAKETGMGNALTESAVETVEELPGTHNPQRTDSLQVEPPTRTGSMDATFTPLVEDVDVQMGASSEDGEVANDLEKAITSDHMDTDGVVEAMQVDSDLGQLPELVPHEQREMLVVFEAHICSQHHH